MKAHVFRVPHNNAALLFTDRYAFHAHEAVPGVAKTGFVTHTGGHFTSLHAVEATSDALAGVPVPLFWRRDEYRVPPKLLKARIGDALKRHAEQEGLAQLTPAEIDSVSQSVRVALEKTVPPAVQFVSGVLFPEEATRPSKVLRSLWTRLRADATAVPAITGMDSEALLVVLGVGDKVASAIALQYVSAIDPRAADLTDKQEPMWLREVGAPQFLVSCDVVLESLREVERRQTARADAAELVSVLEVACQRTRVADGVEVVKVTTVSSDEDVIDHVLGTQHAVTSVSVATCAAGIDVSAPMITQVVSSTDTEVVEARCVLEVPKWQGAFGWLRVAGDLNSYETHGAIRNKKDAVPKEVSQALLSSMSVLTLLVHQHALVDLVGVGVEEEPKSND